MTKWVQFPIELHLTQANMKTLKRTAAASIAAGRKAWDYSKLPNIWMVIHRQKNLPNRVDLQPHEIVGSPGRMIPFRSKMLQECHHSRLGTSSRFKDEKNHVWNHLRLVIAYCCIILSCTAPLFFSPVWYAWLALDCCELWTDQVIVVPVPKIPQKMVMLNGKPSR